jgi:nucleotide-binding universal stress UspA family protein
MFSTILCATDGSDHANKAVAVAADLGRRYNARVILLTAYDPIPRELGEPNLEDLMGRRLRAAEGLVNAATAVMKSQGITPVVEVLEGPAARAILEVTRTRRCDLIVMRARGLSPFGAMLLGSVSMRVLHEAPCDDDLTASRRQKVTPQRLHLLRTRQESPAIPSCM